MDGTKRKNLAKSTGVGMETAFKKYLYKKTKISI